MKPLIETRLLAPLVHDNLRNVARLVREHDWDWLVLIVGRERVGKTNLATLCGLTMDDNLHRAVLCEEWNVALASHAWDMDALIALLLSSKPGAAITYQESSVLGRESMKAWNLRMVRVQTTVGMRNVIQIWTFPKFAMLDPYIRERTRTRIQVFTRERKRGFAKWYAVREERSIAATTGSAYYLPAFIASFPDIRSFGGVYAEYWELLKERERHEKEEILRRGGRRSAESLPGDAFGAETVGRVR